MRARADGGCILPLEEDRWASTSLLCKLEDDLDKEDCQHFW